MVTLISIAGISTEAVMLGLPTGSLDHARVVVLLDVGQPWRADPAGALVELTRMAGRIRRLADELHDQGPDNRLDLIAYGTPWWPDETTGEESAASATSRLRDLPTPYPSLFAALLASASGLVDGDRDEAILPVILHVTSGHLDHDDLQRSARILDGMRASHGVFALHVVMQPGVLPPAPDDGRSWRGITNETTLPGKTALLLTMMSVPMPPAVREGLRRQGYVELEQDALLLVPATRDRLVDLAFELLALTLAAERSRLFGGPPDDDEDVRPSVSLGASPTTLHGSAPLRPPYADENVQFTVYRPERIRPGVWYSMLAFAHLSEARPGAVEPDPVEEVRRQASQVLGPAISQYRTASQDSAYAVPERGELTFVPEVDGIEFNPPGQTFQWLESVHREEFRLRAAGDIAGDVGRGRLTVYLGRIILAEVNLTFRLDRAGVTSVNPTLTPVSAGRHRRIFPSYSHRDAGVVAELREYALAVGDEYMQDVLMLRSGERWSDRLQELIREADIFQLFWSSNAMRSPHVRTEWEHALSLGRPGFIRPIFWESPMPRSESPPLPPPDLDALHFRMVAVRRQDDRRAEATGGRFRDASDSTLRPPVPSEPPPYGRAPVTPPPCPMAPAGPSLDPPVPPPPVMGSPTPFPSAPAPGASHPDPITPRASVGSSPGGPPPAGYSQSAPTTGQYRVPASGRSRSQFTAVPITLGLTAVLLLVVIAVLLRYLGVL